MWWRGRSSEAQLKFAAQGSTRAYTCFCNYKGIAGRGGDEHACGDPMSSGDAFRGMGPCLLIDIKRLRSADGYFLTRLATFIASSSQSKLGGGRRNHSQLYAQRSFSTVTSWVR